MNDKNSSPREIKKDDNNNNLIENKKYSIIFFILFLFIGLINNLGYVLILTGSQQLTDNFDNKNIIALYPLALIGFSSLARFINSKFCIKISYTKRLLGLSLYFFSGYISLFIILNTISENDDVSTFKFFLTLIPTIIMGTGSSFGEATMLGYIKNFPSNFVAGWGSGTGFAGVTGATISLFSKKYDLKLKYLYLFISPVALIYFIFYYISKILKEKLEKNTKRDSYRTMVEEKNEEKGEIITETKDKNLDINYDTFPKEKASVTPIINQSVSDQIIKTDASQNKEFTCDNFKKGFHYGKRCILNLGFVYYLEYVIISGLAERVSNEDGDVKEYLKPAFFHDYLYETFSLAYQIGVVISRSSLPIVKKIPYVEMFTLFQLINVIIWFIEYYSIFITSEYILFFHLIFTGLNGGSSYVGCFYYIMNSKYILPEFKELCINIGTIFNDCGILSSSITCLILDNTIMKNKK